MKLLILADLHLDEIAEEARHRLGRAIRHVGRDAELLIIAGDLAEAAVERWPDEIRWLGTLHPAAKTVIFPGNHDYYRSNLDTLDRDLARICQEAGCGFAQCRRLVLGDTRILMATLWTDMRLCAGGDPVAFEESIRHAGQRMPDYAAAYGWSGIVIGEPERPLRPEDTIAVHERQKSWVISELERPWPGKTVVVTHHAPSASVAGRMTPLSPCFASDLDGLIDRHRPAAWIFGHTHRSADLRAPGGTLLRNVSIGYEHEFRPGDPERRVRRGLIDLDAIGSGPK